jgi:hypothetical protein
MALVGWMPSAFDLSIWHSLWTVAHSQLSRLWWICSIPQKERLMARWKLG